MGAYGSQFQDTGYVATDPRKPDWITSHAIEGGLDVPEVERLWRRFQQLGCNMQSGVLTVDEENQKFTTTAKDDIFIKNIFRNVQSGAKVTFLTFINFMKFCQSEGTEEKVRAAFQLLNNGHPVNADIMGKVMRRVYTAHERDEEAIKALAKKLVTDMTIGTNNKDLVTEDIFVNYMLRFPPETLDAVLNVDIIPRTVRRDVALDFQAEKDQEEHAQRVADRDKLVKEVEEQSKNQDGTPSGQKSPPKIPQIPPIPEPILSGKALTDDLLHRVARAISPKADWRLLANRLGFLQDESDTLEVNYADSRVELLYEMLRVWRRRGRATASAPTLRKALAYCRMPEAANLV